MKQLMAMILAAVLVPALNVMARNNHGNQDDNGGRAQASSQPDYQKNGNDNRADRQAQAATPVRDDQNHNVKQQAAGGQNSSENQPVVINMKHGSSGGHNKNYPAQQQQQVQQQAQQEPSYGRLQWTQNNKPGRQSKNKVNTLQQAGNAAQNNHNSQNKSNFQPANTVSGQQVNAANVAHHHPYEQGYVRKKLQKLGVKAAPGYITNRSEVISTDREHSRIAYPVKGIDNRPLNALSFSVRHFNDSAIKSQMSLVVSLSWQDRIRGFNRTETAANRYYWHTDKGFNYCHYIDGVGYHWYGWYVGSKYFWTRNFNNRWWWYDADFDRWCFWNNGFWWWQDPYHMADLYLYNNTDYVPLNSAEDDVAVTVPDNDNLSVFTSPDKTRVVKVVADTQDAFLYDTANPPEFNPVYLASGVQDVMFSDASNGRPLEIILKLNDKSFDMFDGYGNPYNTGAPEAEQPIQK